MRELEEIIRKYFSNDNDATVYFDLDQELFNKVISNLKEYEKPDILSIFDNKVVAIEHFEFDSYKRSRKGSEFQIENNIMERNFDKEINEKLKTQIGIVKKGIDFLGYRRILTNKGRIIVKLRYSSKQRMKRHLKTINKLHDKGIVDDEYVYSRKNAFFNHIKKQMRVLS